MRNLILSLVCMSIGSAALSAQLTDADAPQLGQPAGAAAIAAVATNVFPDGRGLPSGSGSVSQGELLYGQHCVSCHGTDGSGGINDPLAGGHGTLSGATPVRTVGSYWPYATTVFDYIRRAMPYLAPGSLTDNETYALTAYLLYLNGIVGAEATVGADNLANIRLPNRENFIWAYRPGAAQ